VGAALAAREIATKVRIVNPETAFLAGLFHDIGKTIMNDLDPKKFQTVMMRCYNEMLPFERWNGRSSPSRTVRWEHW